jgi:hypothetical protein
MQQNPASAISDDDYHLIEVHHLGKPLTIYRLRQGAIGVLRALGLLALLVSSIIFAIAVLELVFIDARNSVSLAFVPIGLSSIIVAFIILSLAVPQQQSDHIIICEQGLLHIKKKIRTERVTCLYWNDIVVIGEGITGLDYFLRDREGQVLTLTIAYQNLDELLAHIRHRSEEAGYEREC